MHNEYVRSKGARTSEWKVIQTAVGVSELAKQPGNGSIAWELTS